MSRTMSPPCAYESVRSISLVFTIAATSHCGHRATQGTADSRRKVCCAFTRQPVITLSRVQSRKRPLHPAQLSVSISDVNQQLRLACVHPSFCGCHRDLHSSSGVSLLVVKGCSTGDHLACAKGKAVPFRFCNRAECQPGPLPQLCIRAGSCKTFAPVRRDSHNKEGTPPEFERRSLK